MASGKISRGSSVWEHFEKVDGGTSVRCQLCETKLKFNGSTTSSMREHLTRKHVSSSTAVAVSQSKVSQARRVPT